MTDLEQAAERFERACDEADQKFSRAIEILDRLIEEAGKDDRE